MQLYVIGAGSVGMLCSYFLAKSGFSPTLVTKRKEQAKAIQKKGLHYETVEGEKDRLFIPTMTLDQLSFQKGKKQLIIAVKSYDIISCIRQISCAPDDAILFLQNGMAHIKYFTHFSRAEVACASVEFGAKRINDYTVVHTGIGPFRFSYINRKKATIAAVWKQINDPHFPVVYSADWKKMLERKLIINVCINPLTALLQIPNGDLLKNAHAHQMMQAVFNELLAVMTAHDAKKMWQAVCTVCQNTKDNYSSMYVDIQKGRKTEIQSFISYVLEEGKKKHIPMPLCSFLYDGIQALER